MPRSASGHETLFLSKCINCLSSKKSLKHCNVKCENVKNLNHCRHAKFVVHHQQKESRPCKYPAVTSGSLLVTPTSNQIIRRLYPGVDTAVNAKPKRFQFIISYATYSLALCYRTVFDWDDTLSNFQRQQDQEFFACCELILPGWWLSESLMRW